MIKEQEQVESKPAEAPSIWTRPPDRMTVLVPVEVTADFAEAVAAAAKLPVEDQNYLAWRLQEEMAEEKKWMDSLASSTDFLDKMVDKVRIERERGELRPLEDIL